LQGSYTQFGFESKSQLGVLWQLRFEHYVASREMGRHSHAKKRRFFHGLRNTWNTMVHLLCYMCCHHNSKHFIICSDIYPVCLKWRIFAVLYSYETKALCQVARIELLLFSWNTMRWFLLDAQKPKQNPCCKWHILATVLLGISSQRHTWNSS
jgi:hypothetical protein